MTKTINTKATKTAAQQAEFDRLRAEKKAKQAAAQEVLMPEKDEEALLENIRAELFKSIDAMVDRAGLKTETWKRKLCAFVASFAIGFVGASVTMQIISSLLVGGALLGTSMFLTYAIAILIGIAGVYYTIKAGQKVGMWIATGDIDRDFAVAKTVVRNWFNKKEVVAA